ncbi:MAG: universal stress protein [Chitinophagaceae bacterium]
MEKILLAIDAINLDKNSLEFACYLAQLTKSKVTGVFLENLMSEERPVLKQVYGMAYADSVVDEKSDEHRVKLELLEKNISFFKEGCINRGVNYSLHRDRGVPALDLMDESRFADLIVVDAETSFNKRYEGSPTEFVKDILKNAECPVMIAPYNFEAIDEIKFTYNGSSSSVFAIKQFTYLFPQLHTKKVSVLQVNDTGEWKDPDKYKFKEWLNHHYTDFRFDALKGDADTNLLDCWLNRKNSVLVMGAYGRNALSRFFKASHADLLIKTVRQPIFIAHV